MYSIRRSEDRGHFDHGWLDTYHTFSFGDYYDPAHVRFGHLRVLNEDRVIPGKGFPTHPHRDMEIITYVLSGALEHKDSLGTGSIIRPGDVQRMSAGTGVTHSEFNPSQTEPVHFLQIWIVPNHRGNHPSYAQKSFSTDARQDRLCLLASPDGRDDSITIDQDTSLYAALLSAGHELTISLEPSRRAWLHLAKGSLAFDELTLRQGDGVGIRSESQIKLAALADAELILIDLP